MEQILLAVNGTLMRGLELNDALISVGAEFVEESATAPCYRLWSINDRYPAMIRDDYSGQSIQVEVWRLSQTGLISVLAGEPQGLCLGKVSLICGETVLGILGEPFICEGQREITHFGGWRDYKQQST